MKSIINLLGTWGMVWKIQSLTRWIMNKITLLCIRERGAVSMYEYKYFLDVAQNIKVLLYRKDWK